MTYTNLKILINEAYSNFVYDVNKREALGSDDKYPLRTMFFVKCIWKTLLIQVGDETKDVLTKEQIQDCIELFNKYSNSFVEIEYT